MRGVEVRWDGRCSGAKRCTWRADTQRGTRIVGNPSDAESLENLLGAQIAVGKIEPVLGALSEDALTANPVKPDPRVIVPARGGFLEIPRRDVSLLEHRAEQCLRVGVFHFGGLAEPVAGLLVVLRHVPGRPCDPAPRAFSVKRSACVES